MTEIAARQPKGIPAGGQFATTFHAEPGASLIPQASTDIAALAAAEASVLARRRSFLQDQLDMVAREQRTLACAAAAYYVLERHPDAEIIAFTVKDGRIDMLTNVLDGAGRLLPARRTGEWADTVTGQVSGETPGELAGTDGVEVVGTTLRVHYPHSRGAGCPAGPGPGAPGSAARRGPHGRSDDMK